MNFDKLTEYLDSLHRIYGVPAADCKITQDHQVIYRHMAGYSDLENTVPLSESTIYRLFSATKVITATAVLQLVGQGEASAQ